MSRGLDECLRPVHVHWLGAIGIGAAALQLAPGDGLDSAHWAEQEFGGAPLSDKRRSQRLVDSARLQGEQPMRGFTGVSAADWPAVKGYYRLIDQPADSEVTADNILAPHRERTRQRMQAQTVVLCIQDGTDLNFTTHGKTEGLGVIGTNQTQANSREQHLHSTLAVSGDGLPLGEVSDLPPELLFTDAELRVLGDVARSKRRSPPRHPR